MDNSQIALAIGVLLIIAWIAYLDWKVHSLEAKLNLSEFTITKDQNEKSVDSLTKPQLDSAFTKDFGGGSASNAPPTVHLIGAQTDAISKPTDFPDSVEHS